MKTLVILGAVVWAIPVQAGQVSVTTAAELTTAVQNAAPGDEIVVASGTYNLAGLLQLTSAATSDAPIIIRSAGTDRPLIVRGDPQNIIQIAGSYVTLRNLDMSGGGATVGGGGVSISASADHITIDGCAIHDTSISAIRANYAGATYSSLTFSNNELYNIGVNGGAGEGVYVGCAASACTADTIAITGNYIHDNSEAGAGTRAGILLRPGIDGAVIRDNVTAGTAGPGIMVGDNTSADAIYIERNAVLGGSDVGIAYAAGSVVRNNIVIGTVGSGMDRAASSTSNSLIIANNTIVVSTAALIMRAPGDSVDVYNNALFGDTTMTQLITGTATPAAGNNIGSGALVGVSTGYDNTATLATAFTNAASDGSAVDVYPKAGGPLIGAGNSSHQPTDDFNTTSRDGTNDVGAYVYATSGNPGWAVAATFKTFPTPTGGGPGGDSDTSGGDSDTTGGDTGGDSGLGDADVGDSSPNDSGTSPSHAKSGCAAVGASWMVSLLAAIAMLARRRRQVG